VLSSGNSESDLGLLDVAYAIGSGFLSSTSSSLGTDTFGTVKAAVKARDPVPQHNRGTGNELSHKSSATSRISRLDT
jgi:hypothetical protein